MHLYLFRLEPGKAASNHTYRFGTCTCIISLVAPMCFGTPVSEYLRPQECTRDHMTGSMSQSKNCESQLCSSPHSSGVPAPTVVVMYIF